LKRLLFVLRLPLRVASLCRRALRAALRLHARLPLRLTRQGFLWLLTVAVLLGLGVFKNINLLALLGYVLLAVLVLNALAAGRRLRRLEARRRADELVFAGSRCRVELRLQNLARRPCSGVRLEDAGPDHALGWYLDRVEEGGRRSCSGEVVLPRRGWYEFGPVVASSGHPFGLVRRQTAVGPPSRVLVLPRPGKLLREQLRHQLRGADPRGERPRRRGWRHEAAQADFHGLRSFRPGDSPRWIHWRTSARRGEWMVREMEDAPGDDLVLVLDATAPAGEGFEEAVALAATLVQEWCRRRGDRLVLAVWGGLGEVLDGVTGRDHARLLLERLALVQPDPAGGADLLEPLARVAPKTAAVVVVSAGPSLLPRRLEACLARPVTPLDVSLRQEWRFYQGRMKDEG
jgi:uncharacterized protein (DUF58 family)